MADELVKPTAMMRKQRTWDLLPSSFGEAMELANLIAGSDFAPKGYQGKPANVLIATQMGADLGFSPLQSLSAISVINGTPAIYGDSALALAMASGVLETFKEWEDDKLVAHCLVKRKGFDALERTFGVEDAKTAGLAGKPGPHTQYPRRMRQMRARGFALRDAIPDILKGLGIVEEVRDIQDAMPIEQSAEEAMLASLTERERTTVQKAVEALHLSPAQTRVFIMRHLTRSDRAMSESVACMLDDMRDEFSKRKTGKPAKKQATIEAVVVPEDAPVEPVEARLPSPEQMAAEEAAYDGPAPEEAVEDDPKPEEVVEASKSEPKKAAGKGNRFSF